MFMAIFKCYARHKAIKIEDVTLTTVDYSVILSGFPLNDTTPMELKQYLDSNFGMAVEVVFSWKFRGMLKSYQAQAKVNQKVWMREV